MPDPTALDPTVEQLILSSAYREVLVLISLGAVLTVWIARNLFPLLRGERRKSRDDAGGCDSAVKDVILQKDEYGQYQLLSTPRLIRDLLKAFHRHEANSMKIWTDVAGKMEHLVNHQNDILSSHNEVLERLAREVYDTKQK